MSIQTVTITIDGSTCGKTVYPVKTADGLGLSGNVDGIGFRFMGASRATAERELDKALRQAAAWKAILDQNMAR